ncbi:MAG: NAD(P)-dependent oxidoreductase, partial [Gemmatimonadales bacterium]
MSAMTDIRDPGLVVVTGANGFIGRHLCQSLAAKGLRVRGITRSKAGIPIGSVETAIANDLLDRDAIRAALTGAGTVIHLAARVHANPEGKGDAVS